jgi:hypothetical protein
MDYSHSPHGQLSRRLLASFFLAASAKVPKGANPVEHRSCRYRQLGADSGRSRGRDRVAGFDTEAVTPIGVNQADRVETLFTGALASIGLEILSEFFEPGIFGL